MKMYEIEKWDGLYCVFYKGRIISAHYTLKEAKQAIQNHKGM